MLTKEEANELYKIIGFSYFFNPKCRMCAHTGELVSNLQIKVKELTEKPKREIQIGDIYKNKKGGIREVKSINNNYLHTEDGDYSLNGQQYHIPDKEDLDLSKRYKLVEVDDE